MLCVRLLDPSPNNTLWAMRRAARIDGNQVEIVAALRAAGATVQSLATVGAGCPDLVAGLGGNNFLFAVTDGSLCKSRRRLTPDEQQWHDAWAGTVHIVESAEQAVAIVSEALPPER